MPHPFEAKRVCYLFEFLSVLSKAIFFWSNMIVTMSIVKVFG